MIQLVALAAVQALIMPASPQFSDPHLQSVRYQPDRVIALVGYLGYQTMVQFAPDERIENVAIGDATSWQVMPNKRADLLFVKPTARGPATNMVVITNQRTYSFALSVAAPKAHTAGAVWTLRFIIPVLPVVPVVPTVTSPPTYRNEAYTTEGPDALLPKTVADDGHQTFFTWPDEVALPAIFAVNPDGSEEIVNFVVRDRQVVVQQTAGRFVLRQGQSVATVTSTPGVTRRLPLARGRLKP